MDYASKLEEMELAGTSETSHPVRSNYSDINQLHPAHIIRPPLPNAPQPPHPHHCDNGTRAHRFNLTTALAMEMRRMS